MQLSEVLAWKLWGALSWHAVLYCGCSVLWYIFSVPKSHHAGQLLYFATILRLTGSYLTSVLVLYTQRRLLSTTDVPPLYVARLGLSGKSWVSLFITRCLRRNGKLSDLLDATAFYGSCILSGMWTCRSLVLRHPGTGDHGEQPWRPPSKQH
jgi:nucleoporin NDC1